MGHVLAAELFKARAYRWPLIVLVAGLALCALLDAGLGLGYCPNAACYVRMSYSFNELLMREVWLLIPLLLVAGDVVEGTLRPTLTVRPAPGRILAAKLIVSMGLSLVSAVVMAAMTTVPLLVLDGGAAAWSEHALVVLPRTILLAPLAVGLAFAVYVLVGLRALPWTVLGLVAWTQVVEKAMFSLMPPAVSPYVSPYNTFVVWSGQLWGDFDMPELNTWGFAPLLVLVVGLVALAFGVVALHRDPSGRPWGVRAVLPEPPRSASSASGAVAASGAGEAGAAGASAVSILLAPPRTDGAVRTSLLGDVVLWVRTIAAKGGTFTVLGVGALLGIAFTAIGVVAVQGVNPSSLAADGTFVDPKRAQDCVIALLFYIGYLPVLLAGAWMYLREVSSGQIAIVYAAMPRRSAVVAATALVAVLYAAVTTLVAVLVGAVVLSLVTGASIGTVLGTAEIQRLLVGAPVAMALIQAVVVGLAVLARRAVLATAGISAWLLLVEPLLGQVPKIGQTLDRFSLGTTRNMVATSAQISTVMVDAAWLVGLGLVVLGAAVLMERRRTAVAH